MIIAKIGNSIIVSLGCEHHIKDNHNNTSIVIGRLGDVWERVDLCEKKN